MRTDRVAYNLRQKRQRRARQGKLLGVDYQTLLTHQQGVCAICHRPPKTHQLCLDHDHKTGETRGLLCHSCNLALGLLRDDPNILRAALVYLDYGLEEDDDYFD